VSISHSGECSDLPHDALAKYDLQGPLNLGMIDFSTGVAVFGPGPYAESPLGTCRIGGAPAGTEFSYYDFNHGSAGPALNVQTAQDQEQWSWEPYASGYIAPDYGRHRAIPGHYTVNNGEGGSYVGPFDAAFGLSPMSFTWSNADDLAADPPAREKNLDIRWNSGPQQGFATIFGELEYGSNLYPGQTAKGLSFVCVEDAAKGHFTVPSYVWSGVRNEALTPSYSGNISILSLDLSVGFQSRSGFAAPGIDVGLGFQYVVKSRSIKVQ
jgi:hypothetical protein